MKLHSLDQILAERPLSEVEKAMATRQHAEFQAAFNLRQVRKLRHITQQALAALLNVSQNRISQIERGHVKNAQVGTLERYIEALGGTLTVTATVGDETYVLSKSN
jgi:DNA-binding XRE family transcriptional regulator